MAESLCKFPIDKLAGMWYNGIAGATRAAPARPFVHFDEKFMGGFPPIFYAKQLKNFFSNAFAIFLFSALFNHSIAQSVAAFSSGNLKYSKLITALE